MPGWGGLQALAPVWRGEEITNTNLGIQPDRSRQVQLGIVGVARTYRDLPRLALCAGSLPEPALGGSFYAVPSLRL